MLVPLLLLLLHFPPRLLMNNLPPSHFPHPPNRLASLFFLSLFTPRLSSSPSLFPRTVLRHPTSLVRPLTYPSHLSFDQRETCLATHSHCFLLTIPESQSPNQNQKRNIVASSFAFSLRSDLAAARYDRPTRASNARSPLASTSQTFKLLQTLAKLPGVPPVAFSLFSATRACHLAAFLYYGQCRVHLIRSDLHA